jgi:CubicO group peptidase (beta-lactamase class C family)
MEIVTPEAVGFSAERLAQINLVMQAYVDEQKLSGLITLLARRGKVVHFEQFGLMDMEANKPMQADAIFRIASMTKPITTVAVMMLYEKGHFQLSDPVSNFISSFSDIKVKVGGNSENDVLVDPEREITIHDLLIHTSGLVYEFDYDKTLEENMRELVKTPLGHQPGARWQYSQSTSVLAYIVELLSGTSFDRFLRERIFEPLQMKDTAYYVS